MAKRSHGLSNTREYKIWKGIRKRCLNPKAPHFNRYGGRGITICERWSKFENFIQDMGMAPSSSHSIDRMNNDGNYCPENCRWATAEQQIRNSTKAKKVTHKGITKCITEWAIEFGIDPGLMMERLRRGFSFEEAIDPKTKERRDGIYIQAFGERLSLTEAAIKYQIKRRTLCERIRSGWPPELACKIKPNRANSFKEGKYETQHLDND